MVSWLKHTHYVKITQKKISDYHYKENNSRFAINMKVTKATYSISSCDMNLSKGRIIILKKITEKKLHLVINAPLIS